MKRIVITLVMYLTVCLLTPTTARAASGADVSDLWWNPSESGWGMQLVQQATTVFATIFVYDTHGIPIWYTATLNFLGVDPSGALARTRLGGSRRTPRHAAQGVRRARAT